MGLPGHSSEGNKERADCSPVPDSPHVCSFAAYGRKPFPDCQYSLYCVYPPTYHLVRVLPAGVSTRKDPSVCMNLALIRFFASSLLRFCVASSLRFFASAFLRCFGPSLLRSFVASTLREVRSHMQTKVFRKGTKHATKPQATESTWQHPRSSVHGMHRSTQIGRAHV